MHGGLYGRKDRPGRREIQRSWCPAQGFVRVIILHCCVVGSGLRVQNKYDVVIIWEDPGSIVYCNRGVAECRVYLLSPSSD